MWNMPIEISYPAFVQRIFLEEFTVVTGPTARSTAECAKKLCLALPQAVNTAVRRQRCGKIVQENASSLTYFGSWTEKLFVSRRFLVHIPSPNGENQKF
jgi:hypothetical protein